MSFVNAFYQSIVRRNSVYVPTILVGALGFGVAFDIGTTSLWDHWNQGKQWKDIRHKYIEADE